MWSWLYQTGSWIVLIRGNDSFSVPKNALFPNISANSVSTELNVGSTGEEPAGELSEGFVFLRKCFSRKIQAFLYSVLLCQEIMLREFSLPNKSQPITWHSSLQNGLSLLAKLAGLPRRSHCPGHWVLCLGREVYALPSAWLGRENAVEGLKSLAKGSDNEAFELVGCKVCPPCCHPLLCLQAGADVPTFAIKLSAGRLLALHTQNLPQGLLGSLQGVLEHESLDMVACPPWEIKVTGADAFHNAPSPGDIWEPLGPRHTSWISLLTCVSRGHLPASLQNSWGLEQRNPLLLPLLVQTGWNLLLPLCRQSHIFVSLLCRPLSYYVELSV